MRAHFTIIDLSNGYIVRYLTIIDIVRSSEYNKKEIFDNNLELIG